MSDQPPEAPALAAPAAGSGPGAVPPWRTALASFLRGQRLRLLLPAIGALLLLLYPLNGSAYWMHEIELILVLTLVVSGVNLSFGYAGEVQFGQVFILALGAYVTMILAIHGLNDILLLLVIGAVVAFVAGLVIALPALRIGGWSLAMASFFLVVTLPDFVAIAQKYTGGLNGLVGIPTPDLFGRALGTNELYEVTAVVAIALVPALPQLRDVAVRRHLPYAAPVADAQPARSGSRPSGSRPSRTPSAPCRRDWPGACWATSS